MCLSVHVYIGSKYVYAYNWPMYAGLCMHMHRNPNLSFFASVSLFLPYNMPLFGPFLCFLSFCSFV